MPQKPKTPETPTTTDFTAALEAFRKENPPTNNSYTWPNTHSCPYCRPRCPHCGRPQPDWWGWEPWNRPYWYADPCGTWTSC